MRENYIPVLCCSNSKHQDRFCYNGQSIKFVASPKEAPQQDGCTYYRPDDKMPGTNKTWRDLVLEQNNPNLIPAYQLYSGNIYHKLYQNYGDQFYIISAGWGIIRASFKLPAYDITYSTAGNMPIYAQRTGNSGWNDINHLQDDAKNFNQDAKILLFAGKDYAPPFCDMTQNIQNEKTILFTSKYIERRRGFVYRFYEPGPSTNWFYRAAEKICP